MRISVDAFTGAKWKPQYMDELLEVGHVTAGLRESQTAEETTIENIVSSQSSYETMQSRSFFLSF